MSDIDTRTKVAYSIEKKYVEKCARALAKFDGRKWKDLSTITKHIFRERVRTVIDAYKIAMM